MTNYNLIAPVYDVFKYLVFGNSLTRANHFYLENIKEASSIMLVGGGTGELLEHFSASQTVDYVEPSTSMLKRSKKRNYSCTVHFHPCSIQELPINKTYDALVFPFVLDLFNQTEVTNIIKKCEPFLRDDAVILISDFYPADDFIKRWKKLLLRTVIVFFRMTTNHQHSKIVNIHNALQSSDYKKVRSEEFYHGMVFASVWKKVVH